ncbi:MAG: DUF4346 domain-containing protein [Phycisphaerales bacterium]|nr:MAG: DUF4346 domain-containing protein [Phycisphaerales bacterium]
MSEVPGKNGTPDLPEAAARIRRAAETEKCPCCACLHNCLRAIKTSFPAHLRSQALAEVIAIAQEKLLPVEFECLGCAVCHPAMALNALGDSAELCNVKPVSKRTGWPPLPGDYSILRYRAPVAICTLTDGRLAERIAEERPDGIAIVGTLQTENLGIERLIVNVLVNPHIRRLVLCGADSTEAMGHCPGRSLTALLRSGLDREGRIIGAPGKRPVLRNIDSKAVEHFRRTVELVDLTGNGNLADVLAAAEECRAEDLGPAESFKPEWAASAALGHLPKEMVPDPAGYFVLYVDQARELLSLEHYGNDGSLDRVIEGRNAAELYTPAVEQGLVSRLDHAAYLGRELARAERALQTGEKYIQDGVAERP